MRRHRDALCAQPLRWPGSGQFAPRGRTRPPPLRWGRRETPSHPSMTRSPLQPRFGEAGGTVCDTDTLCKPRPASVRHGTQNREIETHFGLLFLPNPWQLFMSTPSGASMLNWRTCGRLRVSTSVDSWKRLHLCSCPPPRFGEEPGMDAPRQCPSSPPRWGFGPLKHVSSRMTPCLGAATTLDETPG